MGWDNNAHVPVHTQEEKVNDDVLAMKSKVSTLSPKPNPSMEIHARLTATNLVAVAPFYVYLNVRLSPRYL